MSDRPIQVGDLVQVVYSCCGDLPLGTIFRVSGFSQEDVECIGCPWKPGLITVANTEPGTTDSRGVFDHAPLSWLKRIPPLDELEGVKDQEPIKEAA